MRRLELVDVISLCEETLGARCLAKLGVTCKPLAAKVATSSLFWFECEPECLLSNKQISKVVAKHGPRVRQLCLLYNHSDEMLPLIQSTIGLRKLLLSAHGNCQDL